MAQYSSRVRHRWFAAVYDRLIEPAGRAKMEPLRRFVAAEAHGRVLEIGAGTGANLPYYDWSKIDALYLTEPDSYMAQRLRRHLDSLPAEARDKVHVIEAPAEALPFQDGAIDCAVVTLTLCSVQDVDASLSELRRVLKPDGEVRLIEHVRGKGLAATSQRLIQPVYGWLAGGCDLRRETEARLQAAGFSLAVTQRPNLGGALHPMIVGVARPEPSSG